MARLKEKYREEIVPELMKEFGYSNVMEAPKLAEDRGQRRTWRSDQQRQGHRKARSRDLTAITGQRPVVTRAKKSIAASSCGRECRSERPSRCADRGCTSSSTAWLRLRLPRIRDFRGVSPNSFDGRGNYTLGLQEQIAFPEIDYDKIDKSRGLELSLVTSAKTDEEGRRLLSLLGMPFARTERPV